ncbi:MAG: hypothetical protein AB1753_06900 [Thermoproteota archaeon]
MTTKFLTVNIKLPWEYDTADVESARVQDALGRVFPHDPTLDNVRREGGSVSITLENQAPPAPKNQPATEKVAEPKVATEAPTAPASADSAEKVSSP